jgi:hypothetical protein
MAYSHLVTKDSHKKDDFIGFERVSLLMSVTLWLIFPCTARAKPINSLSNQESVNPFNSFSLLAWPEGYSWLEIVQGDFQV